MGRDVFFLFALMFLVCTLHAKSGRAQKIMTVKDALNLPQPSADHRIPYGGDPQQFGDLRLPKGEGPHPVVIVIHGGCWRARYDLTLLSSFCATLTEAGVATWSLEYRRVGNDGGGWPGTFEDVARGADHLRVLAQSYPLDLTRVVATGHSAGGHLVAWLAARSRLPKESPLHSEDPLSLRGVVPLAGVMDLRQDLEGGVCAEVTAKLVGGTPGEVPDRYRQGSPIELLPLGLPQRSIIGDKDNPTLVEMVRRYNGAAKEAGDDARLTVLGGAGHFELTTPGSPAWEVVRETVLSLVGPPEAGG